MKKKKKFITVSALLLSAAAVSWVLYSCAAKPMDAEEVKKAVYEQLSEPVKSSVSDTWEDAEVEEVVFDSLSMSDYYDDNYKSVSSEYNGQSVYRIVIKVPGSFILGDIDLIADMKTGKILGQRGRD